MVGMTLTFFFKVKGQVYTNFVLKVRGRQLQLLCLLPPVDVNEMIVFEITTSNSAGCH